MCVLTSSDTPQILFSICSVVSLPGTLEEHEHEEHAGDEQILPIDVVCHVAVGCRCGLIRIRLILVLFVVPVPEAHGLSLMQTEEVGS